MIKMTNFKKLKQGTCCSEQQFYKVEKITGDNAILVNDQGGQIQVNKNYVEECLITSDQVNEEKKVTKTDLASIFLSNPGVVLTVNYNKKVDEAAVKKEIVALYPNKGGKILPEAQYIKNVSAIMKNVIEGEERTMVGRHSGSQDEFGRTHFIDMDIQKDSSKTYDVRQRLVDPRTINWLILKGVKYIKK
jgi:hypothetical protein